MVVENKDFDTGPFYPGGNSALLHFVEQNLCVPETLQGAYQQRINVSFYVLGDGSLADVKVITICPQEMKEEVLRLVKAMPKWKPALKDGKLPNTGGISAPFPLIRSGHPLFSVGYSETNCHWEKRERGEGAEEGVSDKAGTKWSNQGFL